MLTPTAASWTVRGASFALWALAAASVVYWGFRLGGGSSVKTPPPVERQAPPVDPAAIARLLGASPAGVAASAAAPSLASRLQLVGVVAGVSSGGGAAIIAVDGKPAKPFRVGAAIEDGVVLQSVRGRQAVLASGPSGQSLLTLELPPMRGTAVSGVPVPPARAPMTAAQPTLPQTSAQPVAPVPQAQVPGVTPQAQAVAPPQSQAPNASAQTATPTAIATPQSAASVPTPQAPAVPGAAPQAPMVAPR